MLVNRLKKIISSLKQLAESFRPRKIRVAYNLLARRERILFWFFVGVLSVGIVWLGTNFYFKNTRVEPNFGGRYIEGVIGAPRYINPVFADSGEADRTLETLIFSGLFRSDGRGNVEPDLAESVEISPDQKTYLVTLKKDLQWHDGQSLIADDVLFTIEVIKNPELRNPYSPNWQGISVEKISDRTIRFSIPTPYRPFLQNLTVGILPKHLWGQTPPQNFALSDLNLKPIGSGAYRFKNLLKDKNSNITQYTLVANRKYHLEGPYLDTIVIRFFSSYEDALVSLKKKEIDGLAGIPAKDAKVTTLATNIRMVSPLIPRYFAVFLNLDLNLFEDVKIREALSRAIDKERIAREVFDGQADVISSPIVPGLPGALAVENLYNPQKAKELLDAASWKDSDNDGIRDKKLDRKAKNPTKFEFDLLFPDRPELRQVVEIIRENLASIGIALTPRPLSIGEFATSLQARSYRAILFGEVITTGQNPDLFPFWHSSQRQAPGLNFSLYSNKKVDTLLEKIRQEADRTRLEELIRELQINLAKDIPAIFLYRPAYLYALSSAMHVPEMTFLNSPPERLAKINLWFLNKKRVWH